MTTFCWIMSKLLDAVEAEVGGKYSITFLMMVESHGRATWSIIHCRLDTKIWYNSAGQTALQEKSKR